MMINFIELRQKLSAASSDNWEALVVKAIEKQTDKEEEFGGAVIGFSVNDIVVTDDSIEASVCYLVLGEPKQDENGDHQDDDGESYDCPEHEHEFLLVITSAETRWEIV